MKPLQHLWRTLESVPGLKAVKAEWSARLSTEFDSLQTFLLPTNELATCYPDPDIATPLPIVRHAFDDFVAIRPGGGEPLVLKRTDVLVHRFDVGRLAREISVALGLSNSINEVSSAQFAMQLGTLPLSLGAKPAFLTIVQDSQELPATIETIASRAGQPYLLVTPTRRWIAPRIESLLRNTSGHLLPAAELVRVATSGEWRTACSVAQLVGAIFGLQSDAEAAKSVFRLRGEYWQLAFEGKTAFLKDSVGLGYIAHLLMKPDHNIPAVMLLAARTGFDPLIASGSSGESLDDEARKNYEECYVDLNADLEEARENHDDGRIAKLEGELESLANELASATGLGGRARESNDADRVRKSVSNRVSQDIARIKKKLEPLGKHLEASISSGLLFRYSPERKVDWIF